MKLKDMAEPKSEAQISGGTKAPGTELDSKEKGPSYPWGLKLQLNHDVLKKLGVKGGLKAGSPVHIKAHAHVTSVSSNHEEGGKMKHTAELQIHHMALSNEPQSAMDAVDQGIGDAGEGSSGAY